ncbi:MAG: glycosyltransferase family 4 protein [Thermonemataceae bacterium]|nr:glycosyltransferase family 4 protein [Thermonemataceae bacterium]
MKVIFLLGAMPHYLLALLNILSKVPNLQIVVVLPDKKSKSVGEGVYESYENIFFKMVKLREVSTFLFKKPYFSGLYSVIEQEKPDVLMLGWPYILGYLLDWRLRLLMKKRKIKLIYRSIPYQLPFYNEAMKYYTYKGFFDENMNHIKADTLLKKLKYKFLIFLNKYYFNLVDLHLNYATTAYKILESYGVAKEKIVVSYNSGDTDELLRAKDIIKNIPEKLEYSPYRVIHVGRLIKWKKVDMLIRVIADLSKVYPDIELIVIGSGPEERKLKELTLELGLEKKVNFVGAIHNAEKLGIYLQASAVYVLAGVGGLSINDAMIFGKPVICSEADGTEKDLVLDGKTGFIFENNNREDLSKKIAYCFDNQKYTIEMGKNAESLIMNKINIHTVASKFVEAFNKVTAYKYNLKYDKFYTCSRGKT